jgi:L-glutamine-phosphate cytidylyltransferase
MLLAGFLHTGELAVIELVLIDISPIVDRFFRTMNELISAGRVNEFFNVAVQKLANEGIWVGYTSTDGLAWAEIDDPLDLTFAQQNVFPQLVTAAI